MREKELRRCEGVFDVSIEVNIRVETEATAEEMALLGRKRNPVVPAGLAERLRKAIGVRLAGQWVPTREYEITGCSLAPNVGDSVDFPSFDPDPEATARAFRDIEWPETQEEGD
jgi:hypothetical protein